MRRTSLLFSSLIIATGICLAQEQAIDTSEKQSQPAEQNSSGQSDESLRDPELDQAPDAVKEAILRQSEGATLKELDVQESAKGKIYQAVYEGQNVETTLRLNERGFPESMIITGLATPINEAAGAKRDDQPQQATQAQAQTQPATETQQPTVSADLRDRIQQQLGDETPLLDVKPKVFYQLNVRQNGNVQQIWADESGKVLRDEQGQQ